MSRLLELLQAEPVRILAGSQVLVQLVVGLVLIGLGERELGVMVLLTAAGVAAGGAAVRRAVWSGPSHAAEVEDAYQRGQKGWAPPAE